MIQERTTCRGCQGGELLPILSLGEQYVVDFVPANTDQGQCLKAPLELVLCPVCSLLQLKHSVEADRLFRKFWYRSAVNEEMKRALKDVVVKAAHAVGLAEGDRVLDIGANDGTLLSFYPKEIKTVAVDPCRELVEEGLGNANMDVGLVGYFSSTLTRSFAPFKVITAVAMFYDLEDPVRFLQECAEVLDEEGVIVVQMNYLKGMLEQCAFDNICHEHLTYFSVTSMQPVAQKAGLEIVGAETNKVNGGSFRLYLTKPGRDLWIRKPALRMEMYAKLLDLLASEGKLRLDTIKPYNNFAVRQRQTCEALGEYLMMQSIKGKRIYVYGASTRGSTTMQCLNLPDSVVVGAAERDPKKYGLQTVGTWIPIVPEDQARKDAEIFLALPWHFQDSIVKREQQWIQEGGKMLFPLPEPIVIGANEMTNLLSKATVMV